MAFDDYDWSTARVVPTDLSRNEWHVEARRHGSADYWIVSDSTEMTWDEANAWLNNTVCAE